MANLTLSQKLMKMLKLMRHHGADSLQGKVSADDEAELTRMLHLLEEHIEGESDLDVHDPYGDTEGHMSLTDHHDRVMNLLKQKDTPDNSDY